MQNSSTTSLSFTFILLTIFNKKKVYNLLELKTITNKNYFYFFIVLLKFNINIISSLNLLNNLFF